ncbi:hypothetical protein OROGR_013561 [Orobanche gracilis]
MLVRRKNHRKWAARKATFKEKVIGMRDEGEEIVENLVKKGVMSLELVYENRLFPVFDFEPTAYANICKPWEDCLVVKLIGKQIGYGALCEKLRSLWQQMGGYEVRDIHHGYFLVKFDLETDKERVIKGAPWLVYDHYLLVKPWTPDFVAADSKINTTMVWIRIPGLGFQYYKKSILLTLATAIGTPIKIDLHTDEMQRGRYARICVEIDLTQPVVGRLCLRKTWYNIEYEGLHLLCKTCGCYGHLTRNCTTLPVSGATTVGAKGPAAVTAHPGTVEGEIDHDITAIDGSGGNQGAIDGSGGNQGVINSVRIDCPHTSHGEWLVVDRRKHTSNAKKTMNVPLNKPHQQGIPHAANKSIRCRDTPNLLILAPPAATSDWDYHSKYPLSHNIFHLFILAPPLSF